MPTALELTSPNTRAVVDLAGGRLASLKIGDLEILVTEGVKPTRWGSFPMAPWAGRLSFGKLLFEGQVYDFPLTSPPHANHGTSHTQDWVRLDDRTIQTDLTAPWPFGGHVKQTFDLVELSPREGSLTVAISIHADGQPMPALTGWHPWFRRQLDRGEPAVLIVEPGAAYEVDESMIPTGKLVKPPPPPWNECFVNLAADPVIRWPGAIELTIASSFDHWVVYTEPEHAICVEPQSGPPNQINVTPFIVSPDTPLTGSMTLSWTLG